MARLLAPPDGEGVSLADQAYYAIRELIVSLELAPGSAISERDLTERLEIGRTPIREALRQLSQERLVAVYPRRGMFVTTVDVRDLARLCEVRRRPRKQQGQGPDRRAEINVRPVAMVQLVGGVEQGQPVAAVSQIRQGRWQDDKGQSDRAA